MGRREEEEWEQSDNDVADNWEEELEEKKLVSPTVSKPIGKKSTKQIENSEQPHESEVERKQRLELAVKRSDLQNTYDLFGVSSNVDFDGVSAEEAKLFSVNSATKPFINSMFESSDPQSIPEFEKFADYIVNHLSTLGDRKNYHSFLDILIRRLMTPRDLGEVRKMAGILSEMATSKQRLAANPPTASVDKNKKKAPVLLATKKGRDLDLTDYGALSYDEDDDY